MKNMVCIVCPKGCRLQIDTQNGYNVKGNECKRGEEYAIAELTAPVRVLTSTVAVDGAMYPRVSVKSNKPLPKEDVFNAMHLLDDVKLTAPVTLGQVIIKDVCGSGADIVATRSLMLL